MLLKVSEDVPPVLPDILNLPDLTESTYSGSATPDIDELQRQEGNLTSHDYEVPDLFSQFIRSSSPCIRTKDGSEISQAVSSSVRCLLLRETSSTEAVDRKVVNSNSESAKAAQSRIMLPMKPQKTKPRIILRIGPRKTA